MTWSYAPALTLDRDKVRFLCGDVDTTDQLVSDEEIAGNLAMYGSSVFRAGAAVCRHLAARFSRQADIAEDDIKKSLSQRAKAFADRAGELDEQASSTVNGAIVPTMFAGGISRSDKQVREQDTDRVQPSFTRRDDDFPGTLPDTHRPGHG